MTEIRVSHWGELQEALFAGSWIEALGRYRSRCAYRGLFRPGLTAPWVLYRIESTTMPSEHCHACTRAPLAL